MSEKIDPEDQDSNEPIKHSHYSNGVPTGREFEHLYNKVESIDNKVDGLCENVTVIKDYIESQKEEKKKTYQKAGFIAGVISAIIAIIQRVWN